MNGFQSQLKQENTFYCEAGMKDKLTKRYIDDRTSFV
jgi:hypothetical protein